MKNRNAFTLIEMLARPGVTSKHEKRSQSRSAFTLIEMLVVIAIISLLAAILVPAVSRSLSNANKLKCVSNMKGLADSILIYTIQKTRYQTLPLAFDDSKPSGKKAWTYRLLEAGIFPEYGSVGELLEKSTVFRCPEDKGPGSNKPSFAINNYISTDSGTFAPYNYLSSIPNTSQTVLVGEVWGRRDDKGYTKMDPNSDFAAFERHRGMTNLAFVDGHVETRIYQKEINPDPDNWIALWRPDL